MADLNEAIALDPNYEDAYLHRGSIRHDHFGDLEGVMEDFNNAVALNAKSAYALHDRGLLKARLGACAPPGVGCGGPPEGHDISIFHPSVSVRRHPYAVRMWACSAFSRVSPGEIDEHWYSWPYQV